MKVQDVFKDIDTDLLADKFSKYSECIKNIKSKMGDEEYKKLINNTVENLLKIKTVDSKDFLIVPKIYDYDMDDTTKLEEIYDPCIVLKKDLVQNHRFINEQIKDFDLLSCKQKQIENYSLFLIPPEEILGHQFSDYAFKINDKYEVISAILFELTWFGFDSEVASERIEEEKNEIYNILSKEENMEKFISINDIMENTFNKHFDENENIKIPSEDEINKLSKMNLEIFFKYYKYILDNLE